NRADHLAKPRHLQVFNSPDFEHQGAEVFADKTHPAVAQINRVKVPFGKGTANGIIGWREGVNQVEQVGQIAPQDFLFIRAETERNAATLLNQPGVIPPTYMLTAEFVAKPAKPFLGEIVTKEFHRVRIRQIQCGITIETRQPGTPFLVLQKTNQLCQIAYSRIAVILYGLPEMFGRIVSSSKELDAFFDWIPIREHAS